MDGLFEHYPILMVPTIIATIEIWAFAKAMYVRLTKRAKTERVRID